MKFSAEPFARRRRWHSTASPINIIASPWRVKFSFPATIQGTMLMSRAGYDTTLRRQEKSLGYGAAQLAAGGRTSPTFTRGAFLPTFEKVGQTDEARHNSSGARW